MRLVEEAGLLVPCGDLIHDIVETQFAAEGRDLIVVSFSVAEEVGRYIHLDIAADSG